MNDPVAFPTTYVRTTLPSRPVLCFLAGGLIRRETSVWPKNQQWYLQQAENLAVQCRSCICGGERALQRVVTRLLEVVRGQEHVELTEFEVRVACRVLFLSQHDQTSLLFSLDYEYGISKLQKPDTVDYAKV